MCQIFYSLPDSASSTKYPDPNSAETRSVWVAPECDRVFVPLNHVARSAAHHEIWYGVEFLESPKPENPREVVVDCNFFVFKNPETPMAFSAVPPKQILLTAGIGFTTTPIMRKKPWWFHQLARSDSLKSLSALLRSHYTRITLWAFLKSGLSSNAKSGLRSVGSLLW